MWGAFNNIVWIPVVICSAVAVLIYCATVYGQKEDWSLGVIRVIAFLGMVVSALSQSWYWFAISAIILILSLVPGEPESNESSEGGDVVDNDSSG